MNHLSYEIKPDWAKMWENGILGAWAQQWIARHGSIEEAWNHRAEEYDRDLEHSNRVRFVEKIERHKPETILDIGAGTGIFSLALAKNVKKVAAVEPAVGMLDILKRKAAEYNLTNIEYINKKWEDVSIDELTRANNGKYDVVISSHALYYITNLHHSFQKMNDISRGYVYLFIIGERDQDTAYTRLWERLYKKRPSFPDYACLYMVLREIGIHPNIELLDEYVKRYIKNMDEELDRWIDLFGFDELTPDQKDAIQEYLADMIKEENGKLYWERRSKVALIYWKVE